MVLAYYMLILVKGASNANVAKIYWPDISL